MTHRFITILFLFSCLFIYSGCNSPFDLHKYHGFRNVIDVNHIKSVSGKTDVKVLDIHIPLSDSMTFDYNKSLKDVHFIKLETKAQSKINNIDKILLTKNRIIIVDFKVAKGVYVFDSSGRFISSIFANSGIFDSKAAVSDFYDVAYDYKFDEIILHDQTKHKSYYFDQDGNFKNSTQEYVYFVNFVNIKNTDYFVYLNPFGGNDHIPEITKSTIYIGKKDTRILFTATNAIHHMKANVNYQINNNLSFNNSNSKLFYTPEFSDTVYQIIGHPVNVYPKLVVHYPELDINSVLKKRHTENIESFTNLMNTANYYSFQGEVICNDDLIYYLNIYKNGSTGYFYSEKTHGSPVSKLFPADTAQLDGYKYPVTTFNSCFVSILHSSDFQNSNWLSSSKLSAIKKGIRPADNPILAFYRLKEF